MLQRMDATLGGVEVSAPGPVLGWQGVVMTHRDACCSIVILIRWAVPIIGSIETKDKEGLELRINNPLGDNCQIVSSDCVRFSLNPNSS